MMAIDTEDTGLDFWHGAKPFFVTTCADDGTQRWWEWDVDPLTRTPDVPRADLNQIKALLSRQTIVLQNAKFDAHALASVDDALGHWPWDRTHDTLIAGHLLASNQPHDLTSMALHYLGVDIRPFEDRLEKAVQAARRVVQQARLRVKRKVKLGYGTSGAGLFDIEAYDEVQGGEPLASWAIAEAGRPDMPSAKEKTWKADCWLPRALLRYWHLQGREVDEITDEQHSWEMVLCDYANTDSAVTLALWQAMEQELHRRGLWEIYLERMKAVPVAYRMEEDGLTVSRARLEELRDSYRKGSDEAGDECVAVAAGLGYDLQLPKGASPNKSLREFCFGPLGLPVLARSAKTGEPTLDRAVLEAYKTDLPPDSAQARFVNLLTGKRSRDTALSYMEGYERFWLPLKTVSRVRDEEGDYSRTYAGYDHAWFLLHPSLNIVGTDTLRWSSSCPNEQNISKKEDFNLRYCFGPAPGREWWSLDAKNIERRLPAYEAGETEIIALFERPDDPPYYGSEHALVAHVIHPKLFEACRNEQGEVDGRVFKKRYAATYYQWVKNFNFAVQYGCQEAKGDATAHSRGAYRLVKQRFAAQDALNRHWIAFAEKHGYIETMPDKSVNPKHGYPLLCTRTDRGRILPTVPLNYHISGSAMWWMGKAMVRCQAQLDEWRGLGFTGRIALQVHDELVFDFPRRGDPAAEAERAKKNHPKPTFRTSNLWRVRVLQKLMEQGGDDFGIPTPVGVEYHAGSWSEGVSI